MIYLAKWKVLQGFFLFRCNLVLYHKKAYNYLNIEGNFLDIYFWIALMVSQRSLWMEFATMPFLSLPQSKGVFLPLARDLVVNGCGLPYINLSN